MLIVRAASHARAWVLWLACEWRLVWATVGVPSVACAISLGLYGKLDDVVRFAGMLLQLAGIGTVLWSVSGRRNTFGLRGLPQYFADGLSRMPKWRKVITFEVSPASLHLHGRAGISAELTANANVVEERVKRLESEVQPLRSAIAKESEERKAGDKVTRQEGDAKQLMLHDKVKKAAAGGSHWEAIGAFWLILGVILGTLPL